MKIFLSVALLVTLVFATPKSSYRPKLKAISAENRFPAASLLGASIEGVSCDKHGRIYAVNQTHMLGLSDAYAKPLIVGVGGKKSYFASSRFTRRHGILVGDAVAHKVVNTKGKPVFANKKMLQPNDMTINRAETYVYLSGMNYTGNTGDLWVFNTKTAVGKPCKLPKGKTFRTNGIELSPDDSVLYLSSAENSADGTSIVSAKIWKMHVDKATGRTSNPKVAFDLYKILKSMGFNPKKAGMDPDGMRMDSKGTLFITLNAFQKVLKLDTKKKHNNAQVIELETVKFPSNCEFGGADGKDLVIVGRCADGKSSCVDIYRHNFPGRAFTNLNIHGKKKGSRHYRRSLLDHPHVSGVDPLNSEENYPHVDGLKSQITAHLNPKIADSSALGYPSDGNDNPVDRQNPRLEDQTIPSFRRVRT